MISVTADLRRFRKPDMTFLYKTVEGVGLPANVYMPKSENTKIQGVIVYIHGGGWQTGAVKERPCGGIEALTANADYMSEHGYIGVTITYRGLNITDTTTPYDMLEDCGDAVEYIRNTSFAKGKKLIVFGESAGGHLAVMLGFAEDKNIRPDGIMAINPVLDCMNEKWSYAFKGNEERENISPLHCNPPNMPPILIMHGTADDCVPISDSRRFAAKINACGGNASLIEVQDAVHAFILYGYKYESAYAEEKMQILKDAWDKMCGR